MNNRPRLCIVFALTLSALVAPTELRAGSPVDSVHTLQTVVVTARSLSREVIPVQSLAGETLQRLSAVSIADALRYFAGVQIKDYGGIGGDHTLILLVLATASEP